MGYGIPAHLRRKRSNTPRPAPPALAASEGLGVVREAAEELELDTREAGGSTESDDSWEAPKRVVPLQKDPPSTTGLDLFDVGHLLEDGEQGPAGNLSRITTVDSGCASISAQDFAHSSHANHGSHAFLRDVGGILNTAFVNELRNSAMSPRRHHDSNGGGRNRPVTAPIGVVGPMLERHETEVSLQDAGGLLGSASRRYEVEESSPSHPGMYSEARTSTADEGGWPLDDDRRPDHSAIALQPMQGRRSLGQRNAPSPIQRPRGPDDMILHDPGGLMDE